MSGDALAMAKRSNKAASSDDYFKSYGNLDVHELMIKDKPRTLAYKEFIEKNNNLIKDKVVLDVGAGSGILSLFAARAGAQKVYAVEASDIADVCVEIVKANNYEHVITVLKGMIEQVELPEKVDIIISEWMGFYLLHESMLDSVLFARERWLKVDGIMIPSHASILASPVNMSHYCSEHFEFWKDTYGFDFSPFLTRSIAQSHMQPAVTVLKPEQCLSKPEILIKFDLKTVELPEVQEIEEKLAFKIETDTTLHGFATWFDVDFAPYLCQGSSSTNCQSCDTSGDNTTTLCHPNVHNIILSTSPYALETHWKQTVVLLPTAVSVVKGESIYCKMSLCQDCDNKRHYNMSLKMLESVDDTDDSDSYDDDEDDEDHPVPCDCGSGRCKLIRAIMEKYDEEQTELEMEAEFTDVTAEVQAAQTLDNDSSYLDSEELTKDDSYTKDNVN